GWVRNGQNNKCNGGEPSDSGGKHALQIGFAAAGGRNDFHDNSSALGATVATKWTPTHLVRNTRGGGQGNCNGVVGSDRSPCNVTINAGGTANINHNFTAAGTADFDSAVAFGSSGKTTTANSLIFRQASTANVADQALVA